VMGITRGGAKLASGDAKLQCVDRATE